MSSHPFPYSISHSPRTTLKSVLAIVLNTLFICLLVAFPFVLVVAVVADCGLQIADCGLLAISLSAAACAATEYVV